MPHSYWISQAEEKTRYQQHNNQRTNNGYVEHLLKLVASVEQNVLPMGSGIDLGCGPTPVLGELLRERGYSCLDYDPFFYPARELWALVGTFDFVVICEVAEHFKDPHLDWKGILGLLKPGGVVAVSTKTIEEKCTRDEFLDWWYIRDSTHIGFYSKRAVEFLARQGGASIKEYSVDGFVLKRNEVTS